MSFEDEMAEFASMTDGLTLNLDPLDLVARATLWLDREMWISEVPRMQGGVIVVEWVPTDFALNSVLMPVEGSTLALLRSLGIDPAEMPHLFEDVLGETRQAQAGGSIMVPYRSVSNGLVSVSTQLLAIPAVAERPIDRVVVRPI